MEPPTTGSLITTAREPSAAALVDAASDLLDAVATGDTESVAEWVAPYVDWHYASASDAGGFTANGAGMLTAALRRRLPRRTSTACIQAGRNYVVVEERLAPGFGVEQRVGTYIFEGLRVVRAWVFDQ